MQDKRPLTDALEHIVQGVVAFDNKRRLSAWNKSYEKLFDFPEGFLRVGLPNFEVALFVAKSGALGSGDFEKVTTERLRWLWQGGSKRGEVTIKSNKIYDVLFNRTDDGGVVISYTDITELKSAQGTIVENEQQFKNAFDRSPIGISFNTLDGKRIWANRSLAELLGYSKEELANGTITHTSADEEGLARSLRLRQKILDGEIDSYTNRRKIFHKDGHVLSADVTSVLVYGENGEPDYFVSHVVDVTEQQKSSAEISRQRDFLETIGHLSKTGGWSYNVLTQDLRWTSETYRIQDVPEDYVPNLEDAIRFYTEESQPIITKAFEAGLAEGKPWDLELQMITAKGRRIRVRAKGEPVYLNGEIVEILGSFQDITERKKMEDQLRQSQKMEAVGQLTSGIAHDFNNLLGVIIGNAEMVQRDGQLEGRSLNYISNIVFTAERAAALTNRLLAFSRQQPLSPISTDVFKLIEGLTDILQRTLGETVELQIECGQALWPAIIDPNQFENALVNLSINALHAMPNGGVLKIVTSNISLSEKDAGQIEDVTPGDYVKIEVTDSGTGMHPDVLKKVFDPFFTTKEVGEGSGLGLSMVYGFVKQSNGHIQISSQLGLGTQVKLYVPRSLTAAAHESKPPTSEAQEPGAGRILVVEDDENVRVIPVSILRDQGYEVVEAETGKQAIDILKEDAAFDLLFTDVILSGGMDGVETSKRAKQIQPSLKTLFTTGYSENKPELSRGLIKNMTILKKPYRRTQLLDHVATALEGTPEPNPV